MPSSAGQPFSNHRHRQGRQSHPYRREQDYGAGFLSELSRFGSPPRDHDGSSDADAAGHDCHCGRRVLRQIALPLFLPLAPSDKVYNAPFVGCLGWGAAGAQHTVPDVDPAQFGERRVGSTEAHVVHGIYDSVATKSCAQPDWSGSRPPRLDPARLNPSFPWGVVGSRARYARER